MLITCFVIVQCCLDLEISNCLAGLLVWCTSVEAHCLNVMCGHKQAGLDRGANDVNVPGYKSRSAAMHACNVIIGLPAQACNCYMYV